VFCRRTESDRPGNGGWFHHHPDREPRERIPLPKIAPIPVRNDPAASEVLNRVYRRLLAACPLSEADRAHLTARGLTAEQITRHGYGSLTANRATRDRLAATMLAGESPGVIGHIPGIHRRDGTCTVSGASGILIPVRQNDLIIGIRIRRTEVPLAGRRYSWLSTPDDAHGCSSGAPAHVAMPAMCTDTATVIVTEGEVKANIAADRTGRPVVSVPGVTNISGVIPLLAQLNATDVWIAFDSDSATNATVAQAERKLIAEVIAQGYAVYRLTWPSAFKGLDDALAANIVPVAVAVATVENGKELDHLKRQIAEERQYTAAVFSAINSKQHGPEAKTAATIIHDLKLRRIPMHEWAIATNDRMSTLTGTSARQISSHKQKIVAKFGHAIEVRVDRKADGKELTFVRLVVAPEAALVAIANTTSEVVKNNVGGHRPKQEPECPKCGPDTGVLIVSQFQCADCQTVIGSTPPRTYRKRAPMTFCLPVETSQENSSLINTLSTHDRVSRVAFRHSLDSMEARLIHGHRVKVSAQLHERT
jgi:hypothetical protein